MEKKNRGVAIALAWFLGGFGAHKFYLGLTGRGVMYLLFFWTFIPTLLSVIDCFRFAFMSREEWDEYLVEVSANV